MIITGTGRSGTKYIHSVLTDLGLDMGVHERSAGKDGAVGGYSVLKNLSPDKFGWIVQWRHPHDVIRSSMTSASLQDFPEFGLYRKDYSDKLEYLIQSYIDIGEFFFMEQRLGKVVYQYSIETLNRGEHVTDLIDLLKLKCSVAEFTRVLGLNRTPEKMNIRSHERVDIFTNRNSFKKCLELYELVIYEHQL